MLKWLSIILCISSLLWAQEPLPIGNLSIPPVTQLGPLISFGQLLIGERALLSQLMGINAQGDRGYTNLLGPNLVYGIRNDLSVTLFVPFNLKNKDRSFHSSGIEDLFVQLEYGLYNKTSPNYTLQATAVANVQFPTGSSTKTPPTGNGSFSYFLGTTLAYTSPNWYAFLSPGANLTTSHHGTKFGNSYLYQCGFAKYIPELSPSGWIFDLMIEFDGIYSARSKKAGIKDPDSGGNVILVTPSMWLSSRHWIFQWGVSVPMVQNLNGEQLKIDYAIAYNLAFGMQF